MEVSELIQLMRTVPLDKLRAVLEELKTKQPSVYLQLTNVWMLASLRK